MGTSGDGCHRFRTAAGVEYVLAANVIVWEAIAAP